ncbi:(2Fe-2S)-binding protein [Ruania halotolerans]|uniref:(2Fe-2S)-binding protein n=1 Tax=Ruania halotolerans TaxID=2897773 RepID=UPI001E520A5E|nr:(2Fe-2S)-binding protein [Ruania halotolerans]UFU06721.1 (2Fe-2S)-binding protein [Ruania halotolerans]
MSGYRRLDVRRGEPVQITVDGEQMAAYHGETLAAVLLAAGVDEFRRTSASGPRGPLCQMGTCFDCVLTVDGAPLTRACLTEVRDGMVVTRVTAPS